MKKLFYLPIIVITALLLSGCPGNPGSSAPPPPWDTSTSLNGATPGDGRVKLEWVPTSGVDYWLFTATDSTLTAFNWIGLSKSYAYTNAATPFYLCGLLNVTPYYFATNGRINNGPGGASSPTISATPYNASATAWSANSALTQNAVSPNLLGVGYTGLTTCSNNTISASGSFAAVGAGGAIFTSDDGKIWNSPAFPPSGFITDLNAVTGYAANQNNPGNPALRWVAVGASGASVYSTDGVTWTAGSTSSANPNNYALRSITHSGSTFLTVGDTGTILSSTDGFIWASHASGTTNNLNGVTHGSIYVAVGDGGTLLTSNDGSTWTPQTTVASLTTNNLRQVFSFGNVIVAVGDSGTVVTSKDNGVTWALQTMSGTPNLVGITAEPRFEPAPVVDAWLTVAPSAQFVVADSNGNVYNSMSGTDPNANGLTWSSAIATGTTSLNALVSSGFGYVAAGNTGATAYAF